jgi:hypothetical protein
MKQTQGVRDIMVTTPFSLMAEAAQEAADCLAAGGGEYFRRFPKAISVKPGSRVYYVEDGYIRGFAVVHHAEWNNGETCNTTGRLWNRGFFIFMAAQTWKWVRPLPCKGFQLFKYVKEGFEPVIIGDWQMPRPETHIALKMPAIKEPMLCG